MTYAEILEQARTCMGPYCKACPTCNGMACKNSIPGPGAKGYNADPLVGVGMVDGAAHHGTVGIVGRLPLRIVHQNARYIGVEAAVGEYVVAGYGLAQLIDTFEAKLTEAYSSATVVCEENIA